MRSECPGYRLTQTRLTAAVEGCRRSAVTHRGPQSPPLVITDPTPRGGALMPDVIHEAPNGVQWREPTPDELAQTTAGAKAARDADNAERARHRRAAAPLAIPAGGVTGARPPR